MQSLIHAFHIKVEHLTNFSVHLIIALLSPIFSSVTVQ